MDTLETASAAHFNELSRAYEKVGSLTWLNEDFLPSNLRESRELFTPQSLLARQPKPKQLEVYALLSGLPFDGDFIEKLVHAQKMISEIIGTRLHYWVAPENLGLEYCVFKWPSESLDRTSLGSVAEVLASMRQREYGFTIIGIQINPDGCVVAKGFDDNAALFTLRQQLRTAIPWMPSKQSKWAHVPLGRILEPLGPHDFQRLAQLVDTISRERLAATVVKSMKLVHETRWYMEERIVLEEYCLLS